MATDFYISLIYKNLNGSITSDEQRQLEEWALDGANAQIKAQVESVWALAEGVEGTVAVNLDNDFEELQKKIKNQAKVVQMPKRSRSWMSIAAGLAILVGALFAVQKFVLTSSELVSHTAMASIQYFMLEDGSEIFLQKGSTISYNQPLDKSRRVINLSGEAVFHVAHDKGWPLDVKTKNETITVLGTKFHVLEGENETDIQLMEGKISVADLNGEAIATLTRGQSLHREHDGSVNKVEDSLSQNSFAWQTQQLKFDNTPLSKVAKDLELYYKVSISIENAETRKCLLSGSFNDKTIDQVMAVISSIHGIQVDKSEGSIVWKGGSCN